MLDRAKYTICNWLSEEIINNSKYDFTKFVQTSIFYPEISNDDSESDIYLDEMELGQLWHDQSHINKELLERHQKAEKDRFLKWKHRKYGSDKKKDPEKSGS